MKCFLNASYKASHIQHLMYAFITQTFYAYFAFNAFKSESTYCINP